MYLMAKPCNFCLYGNRVQQSTRTVNKIYTSLLAMLLDNWFQPNVYVLKKGLNSKSFYLLSRISRYILTAWKSNKVNTTLIHTLNYISIHTDSIEYKVFRNTDLGVTYSRGLTKLNRTTSVLIWGKVPKSVTWGQFFFVN